MAFKEAFSRSFLKTGFFAFVGKTRPALAQAGVVQTSRNPGGLLCDGSRLSGFDPPLAVASGRRFFVVRNKRHVKFRVSAARPVAKDTGLRCDQTIQLTSDWSVPSYPQPLRRIRVRDPKTTFSWSC